MIEDYCDFQWVLIFEQSVPSGSPRAPVVTRELW
jgi:hypothetical protein